MQAAGGPGMLLPPTGPPRYDGANGQIPPMGPQAPPTAVPPQLADPIFNYLVQDAAFSNAVKKADVSAAAVAASKLIKQNLTSILTRIKPQQQAPAPSMSTPHSSSVPPGSMMFGRVSDGDANKRRSSAEPPSEPQTSGPVRARELHRGDWVLIKSVNKSTDPELQGQEAWVSKLETNGWVEVTIPKLGSRVERMQQRYLQLLTTPSINAHPGGTASAGGGPPGRQASLGAAYGAVQQQQPHPQQQQQPGDLFIPRRTEDGRGGKRQALDPSVRPSMTLDRLLPAKVPSGRATARVKETVRAVRKEMLTLEQNIPWHGVSPSWRASRPAWLKALSKLEAAAVAGGSGGGSSAPGAAGGAPGGGGGNGAPPASLEALVAPCAAAMLELHHSLNTEKTYGLFVKRGAWETRLRELSEGGNNPACLQQLWSEMAEGVRTWLAGGAGSSQGPSGTDRASQVAAYRAYSALDAAAARGEGYMNQVPLERIVGPGREGYAAMRDLVDRERQYIMGRLDSLGRGEAPSAEELAAYKLPPSQPHMHSPFGDYAGAPGSGYGRSQSQGAAPLMGWAALRPEQAMLRMIESEVDTDLDDGPEATDIEDSDTEAVAARAAAPAGPVPEGPACGGVVGAPGQAGGGADGVGAGAGGGGTPLASRYVGATVALLGGGGGGVQAAAAVQDVQMEDGSPGGYSGGQ